MNSILDAPVIAEQKLEYAGFWIRFVAYIIDYIVLGVVDTVLSFAIIGSSMGMVMSDDYTGLGGMLAVYYLIVLVINLGYFVLLESSSRQATLGKMAVGIKVGDELGQRISGMNALGRSLSKLLSGIILGIGYIMAAFDVRKQSLHDKIANTVVYYG